MREKLTQWLLFVILVQGVILMTIFLGAALYRIISGG